jgi:hypothetical protein
MAGKKWTAQQESDVTGLEGSRRRAAFAAYMSREGFAGYVRQEQNREL